MKRPHVRSERRNRLARIRVRARRRPAWNAWAISALRAILRDMVAERLLNDAFRAVASQWAALHPPLDHVSVGYVGDPLDHTSEAT